MLKPDGHFIWGAVRAAEPRLVKCLIEKCPCAFGPEKPMDRFGTQGILDAAKVHLYQFCYSGQSLSEYLPAELDILLL